MCDSAEFEKWMKKYFPTFSLIKREDGWYTGREAFLMYQSYQVGYQEGQSQLVKKIIKKAQIKEVQND